MEPQQRRRWEHEFVLLPKSIREKANNFVWSSIVCHHNCAVAVTKSQTILRASNAVLLVHLSSPFLGSWRSPLRPSSSLNSNIVKRQSSSVTVLLFRISNITRVFYSRRAGEMLSEKSDISGRKKKNRKLRKKILDDFLQGEDGVCVWRKESRGAP